MVIHGERLLYELDERGLEDLTTAHAGVSLVAELYRVSGVAGVVEREVRTKSRNRGLSTSEYVESFLVLWASGGDRCEDFEQLREDGALVTLLGHKFPSPQAARDFLAKFHEEELPLLQAGEASSVPSESEALAGLQEANRHLLAHLQERSPEQTATLDVDATILESSKREAQVTYKKVRGYQPVVVQWAEQDVVVVDEFRDGNVPAGSGNLRVVQRAVEQLPEGVERIRVRGDSALYEQELLDWLDDEGIEYAVSADMSRELRAAIAGLDESAWHTERDEGDALRQWAEVPFVPEDKRRRKNAPVRRYLAIRILKKQGALFADGHDRKHFAVVTNRWDDGLEVLRWHRAKAGTIEHVHDVMTNELAAEALPSKRFGANAAWFRLNALLYNLLSILRKTALPEELQNARPKRLRFRLFNVVGRVVRHAGETLLRVHRSVRDLLDRARLRVVPRRAIASAQ